MIILKEFLKKRLSISSTQKLRRIYINASSIFYGSNLNVLGKLHRTDKIGTHFYTPHYMTHLKKLRLKKVRLLEIGVGGYDDPNLGGNSLKMWKSYFPYGQIYSLDIYDESALQEPRIKIFKGSQVDIEFLNGVLKETGELDIIIDDGSHINEHVIKTFNFLFPKLKDSGIYVVEDTQTSYREDHGGDSQNLNNPKTMMNYFKNLIDCLNSEEFKISNWEWEYFNDKIASMHFYHNLIFIYKSKG